MVRKTWMFREATRCLLSACGTVAGRQAADDGAVAAHFRLTARAERVCFGRKSAALHLCNVSARGLDDRFTHFCEALDEARPQIGVHAQKVVADQHLTIAARPRADADAWNADSRRDARAQLARNALEHDAESTGRFERLRVLDQSLRRF